MERDEWEAKLNTPVTITPREVANRIHAQIYGGDTEHTKYHSCGCEHMALFYLGGSVEMGLYWPLRKE